MAFNQEHEKKEYSAGFLFCGLGGGALGFQEATAHFKGMVGTFRTVVGIDVDPEACKDFEMLTGAPARCMDLFSAEQYEAFHGKKPPMGWREATPADIREACGGVAPDVWFTSAPCKGFSGLLPNKSALSGKYQALNRLTIRGLKLILEAFPKKNHPAAILFENVPRITTRGHDLLREIRELLAGYGYRFHEGYHDCGEMGGLGQKRKRYLLIARKAENLTSFIYQPPKLRVKSIGEVIGPLPMPDDPSCGAMHRLPRLKWKTWVRLALIPAGGDWRDLEKMAQEKYRLEYVPQGGGSFGVQDWNKTGAAVVGNAKINGSNAVSVADVRLTERESRYGSVYRVTRFEDSAPCVTGSRFGSGAPAVADIRIPDQSDESESSELHLSPLPSGGEGRVRGGSKGRHHSHFRVTPFDRTAGTVTGADHVANGAPNVADPRLKLDPASYNGSPGLYGVNKWEGPSPAITGGAKVSSSNTPAAIADPRINCKPRGGAMGVIAFDETAPAVTGSANPTSSNSPASVADPRVPHTSHQSHTSKFERNSKKTGPLAVGKGKEPINTITGSCGVNEKCDIAAVDDPRLGCSPRNGTMKVQAWKKSGDTVTSAGDVHAGGASAVADPRVATHHHPENDAQADRKHSLPNDNDRPDPVPVIISMDNTWHRPLTTLELAVLQSFDPFLPDGRPLVLSGNSDGKWRERIGNAVPPKTARSIAVEILKALLMNGKQEFMLHPEPVWVKQPVEACEHTSEIYSDDRNPAVAGSKR
jgi:site-specific DNA-cytosine methylase